MRANDRLGGHIVSGHVDGIGRVTHFARVGESWELRILAPGALGKYLAYKGSITVNGVSLTVNRVKDSPKGCEVSINLIPHTVENTALGALQRERRRQPGNRPDRALCGTHAQRRPHAFTQGIRMTAPTPVPISPVEDIVADMRAGRMVILVDEEDRENEGDLVLAADHVTPEAINFMARFGRGLICLTLTRERCEHLQPAAHGRAQRRQSTGTAFTVSIEAAEGVTTGISAADRARTVQAAVASNAQPADLVQPGHIFPLQAVDGGVLMRAGHTEAGCDLAAMAGCSPASVICEIMKDDGTMARLPDLQLFAAEHGLKIGTIADLIDHRSRNESLVEKIGARPLQTAYGEFTAHAFRDKTSQSRASGAGQGPLGGRRHRASAGARAAVGARRAGSRPLHAFLEPGHQPASHRPARARAWPCCSIAAKVPSNCWHSLKAPRAPPRRPSAAAWTCAPTALARRSCANAACTRCASWATRAACPA